MNNKSIQNAQSASSAINATLSVLNGTTPVATNSVNGISVSLNPFQYIIKLLQSIVDYDKIVNFITELTVYGLPMIENSVKISLTEALKNLFSCSVNPVISERIINEGVVLDLSTIDLLNILDRCPLDSENEIQKTKASFFYSGTEGFTIPDQLEKCSDLNAVIWFVKHRANDRTVWYGSSTQGDEHELLTLQSKPSSKDGVITMEYSEKASSLTDSMNDKLSVQVPHGNCLHVFLGNTKGVTDEPYPNSDDLEYKTECFNNFSKSLKEILNELEDEIEESNSIEEKSSLTYDLQFVNKLLKGIENGVSVDTIAPDMLVDQNTGKRYITINNHKIEIDEYTYTHTKNDLANENVSLEGQRSERAEGYSYRTPSQNYYYHKKLFEFNTDYITSIDFFDTKVIISQIVNILTGCFDISLNLSFEERLVRNEVEKMITKIVNNDNTVVSDCFFTFSNEEYNLLLDETEKEHMGLYSGDGSAYGTKIDYDLIYDELNKISNSATLSEQITNINRAFNTISSSIKPETYSQTQEFALNYDFLNNILKGLTLSVVYGIISPKIYLLMAINLKIMGREPNFDLPSFIELFKNMLIDTIRGITDKILEEMRDWLVSLVKDLVVLLSGKLLMEQAQYYMRLLTNCMRSCTLLWSGGTQDWNMDDVNYADIYQLNGGDEAINTNC